VRDLQHQAAIKLQSPCPLTYNHIIVHGDENCGETKTYYKLLVNYKFINVKHSGDLLTSCWELHTTFCAGLNTTFISIRFESNLKTQQNELWIRGTQVNVPIVDEGILL
jgi:hypothetical protein